MRRTTRYIESKKTKKPAVKVSTKETETTHAYRVNNAIAIRKAVRLELQGTLFAHVICSDDETCSGWYGVAKMGAYSKTIAPKYKMPTASKRTIDRHRPELVELGFLSVVHGERGTRMCSDFQNRSLQPSSSYTVNTLAIELSAAEWSDQNARVCQQCEGTFAARREDARYCGATCRKRHQRDRQEAAKQGDVTDVGTLGGTLGDPADGPLSVLRTCYIEPKGSLRSSMTTQSSGVMSEPSSPGEEESSLATALVEEPSAPQPSAPQLRVESSAPERASEDELEDEEDDEFPDEEMTPRSIAEDVARIFARRPQCDPVNVDRLAPQILRVAQDLDVGMDTMYSAIMLNLPDKRVKSPGAYIYRCLPDFVGSYRAGKVRRVLEETAEKEAAQQEAAKEAAQKEAAAQAEEDRKNPWIQWRWIKDYRVYNSSSVKPYVGPTPPKEYSSSYVWIRKETHDRLSSREVGVDEFHRIAGEYVPEKLMEEASKPLMTWYLHRFNGQVWVPTGETQERMTCPPEYSNPSKHWFSADEDLEAEKIRVVQSDDGSYRVTGGRAHTGFGEKDVYLLPAQFRAEYNHLQELFEGAVT